eukprot:m.16337 g.16337  ORF g.16337 m.16337 type:complete len:57 (+) comp7051_c0_seq1:114-284(+)
MQDGWVVTALVVCDVLAWVEVQQINYGDERVFAMIAGTTQVMNGHCELQTSSHNMN